MPTRPDTPPALTETPSGYAAWLADLKARIHTAQQRAALAVNRELVLLYWQIGRDILERQERQGWGAKVIERLAHDLRTAFPSICPPRPPRPASARTRRFICRCRPILAFRSAIPLSRVRRWGRRLTPKPAATARRGFSCARIRPCPMAR